MGGRGNAPAANYEVLAMRFRTVGASERGRARGIGGRSFRRPVG
jgi:hypothetical protein